jgi:hypothetical protein
LFPLNILNVAEIFFVKKYRYEAKCLSLQINNEFLGLITTNTVRLMMRNLLYMMFSMTLLLGAPVSAHANNAIEIVDNDIVGITVTVSESTLRVTGATGLTLSIYNVAGVHVQSFRVEGADRRYELNLPKGCYIVKVGKVVRKISIK